MTMSERERRALETLGYTAGQTTGQPAQNGHPLPDIKEMISHFNRLNRATDLMEEQDKDEAADILERLVHDVPTYFRAMLNLGLLRLNQQNYDAAIQWLERAVAIDPNSDRAHDMLGFAYLRLGKLDLATKHFVELINIRPDSENGHLFLGEIQQRKGNFPLACRHYETVLKINPRNTAARQALHMLTENLKQR